MRAIKNLSQFEFEIIPIIVRMLGSVNKKNSQWLGNMGIGVRFDKWENGSVGNREGSLAKDTEKKQHRTSDQKTWVLPIQLTIAIKAKILPILLSVQTVKRFAFEGENLKSYFQENQESPS